ncbi:MAG: exonuclease domain-containing protein [Lachnospiraceae bacterium]|nr:exonuclease domain-containing protein [Lachnospiraceae bacterium]
MDMYAVIDLEMCAVSRDKEKLCGLRNETIQIGAVLLDGDYNMAGHFNSYVRPQYGTIDAYIRNLTGITRKDIADAPPFREALEAFLGWLPGEGLKIVSWSGHDEKQILSEMKKKCPGMDIGKIDGNWLDCQKLFSEKMGKTRAYQLQEALIAADIDTEGRAHDGYYDAYNTALLFAKIRNDAEFALNPYYRAACEEGYHESLSSNLGSILSGIKEKLKAG